MQKAREGQLDRGLIAVEAGIEDDDFVTRMNQRLDSAEDSLGSAGNDGDFSIGADHTAITAGNLRRHLITQRWQASHRRVLVMPSSNMSAHRITQGLRPIEIREALGQI